MITTWLAHSLIPMSKAEAALSLVTAAALVSTLLVDAVLILADRRWPGAATLVGGLPPLLRQLHALRMGQPLCGPIPDPQGTVLSWFRRWFHRISRDAEMEGPCSTLPTVHFS